MATTDSPNTVNSVDIALRVIEALKEHEGMGVTALANELDLPKSTTHRYLKTLTDNEYLVQRGTTYHIGLRFLGIGEFARNQQNGIELVRHKVDEIAETTGEKAQFIVEEHGKAVYVYQKTGEKAVKLRWGEGSRVQLHSTAAGKVIMADWADKRVDEYIDTHGLNRLTEHTITTREALRSDLETVREQGYGINEQEHVDGFIAIGVPVPDASGTVIGALSVGGPVNRIRDQWTEEEITSLLLGMSNELELNLRYA